MWSAIGTVFGLIIAAESIVSALSQPVWWLLLPILLASFVGIMLLVRCFQLMHRGYISIVDDLSKSDQRTDDQKIADAIRDEQKPDYTSCYECLAILLLWFSAICFFTQAVKSLFFTAPHV